MQYPNLAQLWFPAFIVLAIIASLAFRMYLQFSFLRATRDARASELGLTLPHCHKFTPSMPANRTVMVLGSSSGVMNVCVHSTWSATDVEAWAHGYRPLEGNHRWKMRDAAGFDGAPKKNQISCTEDAARVHVILEAC